MAESRKERRSQMLNQNETVQEAPQVLDTALDETLNDMDQTRIVTPDEYDAKTKDVEIISATETKENTITAVAAVDNLERSTRNGKDEGADMKKAQKNKKPKKIRTFTRSTMITLMVAYAVVMGIIGLWAYNNFFGFYFAEKSPVMGVKTEDSRVVNTPELSKSDMETGLKAILENGQPYVDVKVRQVGPTIHFYIVVPQEVDLETARFMGASAVISFADIIHQPEIFATYEGQIVVTKPEIPELAPEVLLRPANEQGVEQQFPQYGVTNNYTGGQKKVISWSRNGE